MEVLRRKTKVSHQLPLIKLKCDYYWKEASKYNIKRRREKKERNKFVLIKRSRKIMMVTPQQYSLRWNNYFRHLTYALDNHRNNDDFVDVSLLCDGQKIKAHKVVLSACSSYFREIFKENPHPHPVIIFKFIKYEDLNSIIEFMYQVSERGD